MKTPVAVMLVGSLVAGALMIPASDALAAAAGKGGRMYAVTITNLTQSQIFSPPLLTTHSDDVSLFTPGAAASMELADLAENGDNIPLRDALVTEGLACDVLAATDPIMPGASATFMMVSTKSAKLISAAGMLISTNDAFFALDAMELPRKKKVGASYMVAAWDAGTEANSEDCAFIPGPPCGAGAVHDPSPAEGYVYISGGIHGIDGVPAETYDWRNPVALITIDRL